VWQRRHACAEISGPIRRREAPGRDRALRADGRQPDGGLLSAAEVGVASWRVMGNVELLNA